jgi:hypothetical protein
VGEGASPFEAIVEAFSAEGGTSGIRWLARDLTPAVLHRAAELFTAGHTVRQVAVALGISRTASGRLRLKAIAEGLFEPSGEGSERGSGSYRRRFPNAKLRVSQSPGH